MFLTIKNIVKKIFCASFLNLLRNRVYYLDLNTACNRFCINEKSLFTYIISIILFR
jgi:hypothetical protein